MEAQEVASWIFSNFDTAKATPFNDVLSSAVIILSPNLNEMDLIDVVSKISYHVRLYHSRYFPNY